MTLCIFKHINNISLWKSLHFTIRNFISKDRHSNGGRRSCCVLSGSPGHTASLQVSLGCLVMAQISVKWDLLVLTQLLPSCVLPLSCTSSSTSHSSIPPPLARPSAHTPLLGAACRIGVNVAVIEVVLTPVLKTILFICPVWHSVGQIFLFGRSSSHTRIVPLQRKITIKWIPI